MPLQTDIFSARLAKHYSHFDVENRLLFTGHSHQAWPDAALEGLIEAFDVAARKVDTKWDVVFEKVGVMRDYLKDFYDDPYGKYTHAENTHNLIVRWLSALDLKSKPKIIATDSEFYSLFRQLVRLSEENVEIEFIPALPLNGCVERILNVIDDKTSAVFVSRVYFETGLINNELKEIAEVCRRFGVPLMIDDYHGTNVIPMSIREMGLEDCYLLIGGYKYLQWGEGNCFLRYPETCQLRPIITGWFSSFSTLKGPRNSGIVQYDDGDMLFSGATFDGTSAFRGAAVVEFFKSENLTPSLLKKVYTEQTAYFKRMFIHKQFDSNNIKLAHQYPITDNGGFISLKSPKAGIYFEELKNRGVLTDYRGEIIRFGMAPYLISKQIDIAVTILEEVVLNA
jgi:kynureninase